MRSLLLLLFIFHSVSALAWGKRGHQIVGETAAMLAAQEKGAGWLKDRSFDMGYYANVPDFIWKRPKTYEMERNQHFMDLEHFERAFAKKKDVKDPLALSRAEFEAKFPELEEKSGRAFWRVREMYSQLERVTEQLEKLKASKGKERQALQEKWLVLAGTLGHYVGDLAQPLHVTENYDGQMTGQKGVHSYFEDALVDELYPRISMDVHEDAMKRWPAFRKASEGKSVLQLLEQLAKSSSGTLKPLLDIDKSSKRDPTRKNAAKFEKIIRERLVEGALTLGELYRRQVGWKFDGDKFYFFAGEPEYIKPGEPGKSK